MIERRHPDGSAALISFNDWSVAMTAIVVRCGTLPTQPYRQRPNNIAFAVETIREQSDGDHMLALLVGHLDMFRYCPDGSELVEAAYAIYQMETAMDQFHADRQRTFNRTFKN